jgi:hypothetical protein
MVVSFTAVYFTQPVASVIGVVAWLAYLITTEHTDFMGNDRLFYFSGSRWQCNGFDLGIFYLGAFVAISVGIGESSITDFCFGAVIGSLVRVWHEF